MGPHDELGSPGMGDSSAEGRKAKRELSNSKRAAQNRAAQVRAELNPSIPPHVKIFWRALWGQPHDAIMNMSERYLMIMAGLQIS